MARVFYFFSVGSPWSLIGSGRFMDIVGTHGADVEASPVDLMSVFDKTGGLPLPKRSPERRAYRMMELRRWARRLDMPLVTAPKHHPLDERPAQGLLLAAKSLGHDVTRLHHHIGARIWIHDEDASQPEVLARACAAADMDAGALSEKAARIDIDAEIGNATARAMAMGVFGAPGYVIEGVEDGLFWGQDRLDFFADALSEATV